MRKIITIIFITVFVTVAHAQEQSNHELFDKLPHQAKQEILDTRQDCHKDADEYENPYLDAGLSQIFLDKTKPFL